jgi:Na+/H+ antiporter NhaD/arsenite permease-like protein
MANVKMFKLLGVMLALVLIVWAISPFVTHKPITTEVVATAIILILIAIAYLIILYNPSWTKAVFFFEGIVIGVSGYMLLDYPYSIEFVIVGLIIIIIAVLAYLQKLPPKILKWFYR